MSNTPWVLWSVLYINSFYFKNVFHIRLFVAQLATRQLHMRCRNIFCVYACHTRSHIYSCVEPRAWRHLRNPTFYLNIWRTLVSYLFSIQIESIRINNNCFMSESAVWCDSGWLLTLLVIVKIHFIVHFTFRNIGMNVAPWHIAGEECVVSSLKNLKCSLTDLWVINSFDKGEQDLINLDNGIDSTEGEGGPKRYLLRSFQRSCRRQWTGITCPGGHSSSCW